ncbi:MAG: AI-2E family transporter [Burkholderiales bacterium]|nr:AI-2E family transporter [Burkholderiales bacterium]
MNRPETPPPLVVVPRVSSYDIAAWIIAAVALFLTLKLRLLPALLAGLLVYALVHMLAPRLRAVRVGVKRRKLVAVALLATVIVTLITAAILGAIAFFRSDVGNLSALLVQMADIISNSRSSLPAWVSDNLPHTADELRTSVESWLRQHAGDVQAVGARFGVALVHILVGLIIGAMISLHEAVTREELRPLEKALTERVRRLAEAFRRIVFAQVRISTLNTLLTGIYLAVVLPLMGIHLPFVKTMILVTFLAGLLPVVGNLISNTVIVIVSLSYSLTAALGSLAFLVIIHKLEYFVNARIIGSQIRARAWELLLAMLIGEAAFGVAGVVAAPIFYAYIKDELKSRLLI